MNASESRTQTESGPGLRWTVDLEWYSENYRSFFVMVRQPLCPKCVKKLKAKSDTPPAKLIAAINECCSKSRDFVSSRLPVMESIFRILLANGNQPMGTEELLTEFNQRRGEISSLSAAALARLIARDRYYGIKPVSDRA